LQAHFIFCKRTKPPQKKIKRACNLPPKKKIELKISPPTKKLKKTKRTVLIETNTALNINLFGQSVCGLDTSPLWTDRRASGNSGFKKLAVQWLIEHSTSHQHLWWLDSFVLRNRQLLKPTKRCTQLMLKILDKLSEKDCY